MAERVPYAVAANFVNMLASATFRELGRVCGVMDELERLRITVESIKAVLLDAEERQDQDREVQLWIAGLKDVLYLAEDSLDEFFILDRRHNGDSPGTKNKVTKVLHSLSPSGYAFHLKMAHKIKILQRYFNDVVQEMFRLNLNARVGAVDQTDSVLIGKKYFDHDWNESLEKWNQLKTYLMCGAEDNKDLVTTGRKAVAQTMSVMKSLTEEESWGVLKKITFGDDTIRVSQTLESIGKKIANKCRGIPLAIRTLGGILQGKSEESEWMDVLQGDFWKLCEHEDNILPILNLSYQNLSPQMRQCFSYCALYPKDQEIKKSELVGLWMAQGYLQCSNENELMEDVGNRFVKILLMKSFFQDVKMTDEGDIKSFKMHDLMHDLAREVAGNDCCYLNSDVERVVGRPMHVFLDEDAVRLLDSLDASNVRTLILRTFSGLKEEQLSLISNFKRLRSLSITTSFLGKLPDSIGKLKHLRYLYLSGHFESWESTPIPESISNLVWLQTLGLNACLMPGFFENVFPKLINLRLLKAFDLRSLWVIKSSSLANIVEISLFKCRTGRTIPPLEHLPFLKSLQILSHDFLELIYFEEVFPGRTTFFPSLEKLILSGCNYLRGWCRTGDDFNNVNFPNHLSSLPSFPRLSHLSIRNCKKLICMPSFPNLDPLNATLNMAEVESSTTASFDFTSLSKLSYLCIDGEFMDLIKLRTPKNWMNNLTSLQHLCLDNFSGEAFQEMEILFKDGIHCFPSLKKIDIGLPCRDLKALPDWICNLSSLQHMKVSYGYCLTSLPEAMPRLTNLQTLEINTCPGLIEECKKETSAARHRIAHIPNIILK